MFRRLTGQGTAPRGLTLLELVAAIAVLALGALAALRAGDQAQRSLGGAMPRLLAQIAVENRAAELRAFGPGAGGTGEVTLGGQVFFLVTDTAATAGGLTRATITARSGQGPGAVLVVYLAGPGP